VALRIAGCEKRKKTQRGRKEKKTCERCSTNRERACVAGALCAAGHALRSL
jgi:hypothetical protein